MIAAAGTAASPAAGTVASPADGPGPSKKRSYTRDEKLKVVKIIVTCTKPANILTCLPRMCYAGSSKKASLRRAREGVGKLASH